MEQTLKIKEGSEVKLHSLLGPDLYSSKDKLAWVDEMIQNAIDSMKKAGKENEFIDLSIEGNTVVIRDYGVGFESKEHFESLMCNLLESSKENDNSSIGKFGIGKISPALAANTWEFQVNNGEKSFICTFNYDKNKGVSYYFSDYYNSVNRKGVSFIINATKIEDRNFKYTIKSKLINTPQVKIKGELFSQIVKHDLFYINKKPRQTIIIGNYTYEIPKEVNIELLPEHIHLNFDNHNFDINLTREFINHTNNSIDIIQKRVDEIVKYFTNKWNNSFPQVITSSLKEYYNLKYNYSTNILHVGEYFIKVKETSKLNKLLYINEEISKELEKFRVDSWKLESLWAKITNNSIINVENKRKFSKEEKDAISFMYRINNCNIEASSVYREFFVNTYGIELYNNIIQECVSNIPTLKSLNIVSYRPPREKKQQLNKLNTQVEVKLIKKSEKRTSNYNTSLDSFLINIENLKSEKGLFIYSTDRDALSPLFNVVTNSNIKLILITPKIKKMIEDKNPHNFKELSIKNYKYLSTSITALKIKIETEKEFDRIFTYKYLSFINNNFEESIYNKIKNINDKIKDLNYYEINNLNKDLVKFFEENNLLDKDLLEEWVEIKEFLNKLYFLPVLNGYLDSSGNIISNNFKTHVEKMILDVCKQQKIRMKYENYNKNLDTVII